MNKKLLQWLQYGLFLGLGIFLVWWTLVKIDTEQWLKIKTALLNANYLLVIPVVIILLLSHFSRAIRWKILMEPLGYKPAILNTYFAVLVGYFANLAAPRLGEVLKCTLLTKYEKIPTDKLIGTIVAERAFDTICLLIVFAVTVFLQIDLIGNYALSLIEPIIYDSSHHLQWKKLVWAITALVLFIAIIWFILAKFSHINIISKIQKLIKGIWQGVLSIRYIKQRGWFIFHTLLIWSCYLFSIVVGFHAMEQTSNLGIKAAFSILSLGSIGMIATPGGIGAYPFFVQKTTTLYGISPEVGNAFGYLLWTVQFFLVVIFGVLSLWLLPIVNRKNIKYAQR